MMKAILVGLIALILSWPARADERGAIVSTEIQRGRLTFEVEGKKSTDFNETLKVLRNRAKRTGLSPHDDIAIVLASDGLTIAQIQGLQSALRKYGFREIRVLIHTPERERLWELSLGFKAMPFTKDRADLMTQLSTLK
jgi:uncharacterized protein with von Willebrand factor type A (vWA) domain